MIKARICVDGPLLEELGMPVHSLDGSSVLEV